MGPRPTRAQAREGIMTSATKYTNYTNVRDSLLNNQLPLVVRPETIARLQSEDPTLTDDYFRQLGYTNQNDYGFWVRPMYEQLGAAVTGGAGMGGGPVYAGGGGYGGYGGYGDGGGGYGSNYPTDYAVQNARRQTGYSAGNQNNQFGSMPLVSWRI